MAIKLCKDCAHCKAPPGPGTHHLSHPGEYSRCGGVPALAPATIDLITGADVHPRLEYCLNARSFGGKCGPEGELFSPVTP